MIAIGPFFWPTKQQFHMVQPCITLYGCCQLCQRQAAWTEAWWSEARGEFGLNLRLKSISF